MEQLPDENWERLAEIAHKPVDELKMLAALSEAHKNVKVNAVIKSYKLTRKYIGGPQDEFEFQDIQDATMFIQDRCREMRYFLLSIDRDMNDLCVNSFSNSKGDLVYNVSLPMAKKYSIVANLVCIFTIKELSE